MGIFDNRYRRSEEYDSSEWPPVIISDRQDTSLLPLNFSSSLTLATVGAAFLAANVFLLFAMKPHRSKLENSWMCGLTTGGEAECYFDCLTVPNERNPSFPLIGDLNCLDDCFQDELGMFCMRRLLDDVKEKGVCNLDSNQGVNSNSGVYMTNNNCAQYSPRPEEPDISIGTCSEETEENLVNNTCRQYILQLPPLILNTATELINSACSSDVSRQYVVTRALYTAETCGCDKEEFDQFVMASQPLPSIVQLPPFLWGQSRKDNEVRFPNLRTDGTLPITLNVNNENIQLTTMFDFTRTRNRYPWICSMRSKDQSKEHFCAVTILAVPPKPTVIVGPAHCTYLCKNGGQRVPPCCCRTDTTTCSGDVRCGENPEVVEMKGSDIEILCGEWETGLIPPAASKETRNIALDVVEIIRHPDWDPQPDRGAFAGNDIAVFKVNDEKLKNGGVQRYSLNPVCMSRKAGKRGSINGRQLPDPDNNPTKLGIQAGWSEPPPHSFLLKYAPVYAPFYRDFFKMWHYKMDIFESCRDPQGSVWGPMKCPSNTAYPPGVMCAQDFAKQACFSPGESGSPLMVQDEYQRFFAEGILSFVKGRGCDVFSNNPSVYTKLSCFLPWVAEQYGLDYDPPGEKDIQCTVGRKETISDNEACLLPRTRLIDEKPREKCQNIPSNLQEFLAGEQDCIFPFYYNGRKYDKCIVFTEGGFTYPAFRCPVHNITTKTPDGINDFTINIDRDVTDQQNKDCPSFACQIFQTPWYCAINASDKFSELDPTLDCPIEHRRAPFSVCKNNCPGVTALGIIGGGALAIATTGLAAQSLLVPALGAGAAGLAGVGLMMQNQCNFPMCRAQSGQCCRLQGFEGDLRCPTRC